jgi:branched-chain amino acid transport system substrate-binding protein
MKTIAFTSGSLVALCTGLLFTELGLVATGADLPDQKIGVTDKEVVVGSCAPLSGQQMIRGSEVVAGGRAYFSYINDQGGVLGRKIRLVSGDDKYQPELAIACYNNYLRGKCFLGTLFVGTASAVKWVYISGSQQFPMVGFSTGGQFIVQPVHPYAFQLRASYYDEAAEMIKALWNKAGFRKFALISQADAYGAQSYDGVMKALSQFNATPVSEIFYQRLVTTNVDPIIKQTLSAGPDVVIIGGGGDTPVEMIKKLRALHVPVLSFSSTTDLLIEEAGKGADGTLLTQVLPYVQGELPTVQLYKKLIAKYEHRGPSVSSFEGFLIAMTVVEGLKATGKDLTKEKFVHALESIHNFDMGLGPHFRLTFGPNQHDGLRGAVSWTIIRNGKLEAFDDWNGLKKHSI